MPMDRLSPPRYLAGELGPACIGHDRRQLLCVLLLLLLLLLWHVPRLLLQWLLL